MGLLSRIKNRLAGKPAADPPKKAAAPPSPAKPAEKKLDGNIAKDGERPWYLDGQDDVDGWDSTNVKKE